MRRLLTICLLLAPLAVAAADGHATQDDVKQLLIELDQQWGEANIKGDMEALDRLLADDLMAVSGDGVIGKADVIAAVGETQTEETSYTADEYTVMLVDETTAVMTHRVPGPEPVRSVHVWAKRGDSWQVVATTSVPIGS